MKTRRAIPVILLFFLFGAVFFSDRHDDFSGIAAAGRENQELCEGCHPVLADTLPKNHEAVKDSDPASCKKCHTPRGPAKTFEWLVHFKHYSTAAGEIACDACHLTAKEETSPAPRSEPGQKTLPPGIAGRWQPYFKSWAASGFMDREHARGGLTCSACHGAPGAFGVPEPEKCLACHRVYDGTMEKGAGQVPSPHRSHLESPPCSLCHKAHEESVNYCNTENCHHYNFKFPYPNTK